MEYMAGKGLIESVDWEIEGEFGYIAAIGQEDIYGTDTSKRSVELVDAEIENIRTEGVGNMGLLPTAV